VSASDPERVRLDRWLWAARFFKTRSLAARAVDGGRAEVNGEPARRSRAVRVGDRIAVRIGPYRYDLEVLGVADRRGPAAAAAALYRETTASRAARQEHAERLRLAAPIFHEGAGRPTKKQRREIDRWRGRR
jgi:ribosome-associated heat shock protein Hsp15